MNFIKIMLVLLHLVTGYVSLSAHNFIVVFYWRFCLFFLF